MIDPLHSWPALSRLAQNALEGRLIPTILLAGPEGCGLELAALGLARQLLGAEDGAAKAKFDRLAHPDLHLSFAVESKLDVAGYREILDEIAREPLARIRQPSSAILAVGEDEDPHPASVRALRRFVQTRPFEAPKKVAIVLDAHRMNRAAANALLKTLEEPPPYAHIVLTTHQPNQLPATVLSRCARVNMPHLSEAELTELLIEKGVARREAASIATLCDGNARRALDLLDPAARELAAWGHGVAELLLGGRKRAELLKSAELIAKGKAARSQADASLSASRDVGMRVIDFIAAELAARLRAANSSHSPQAIGRAIHVLLRARDDLQRNVNVSLVLSESFHRAFTELAGAKERHAA
jgi:DNA polymerase-3 subunit delta'